MFSPEKLQKEYFVYDSAFTKSIFNEIKSYFKLTKASLILNQILFFDKKFDLFKVAEFLQCEILKEPIQQIIKHIKNAEKQENMNTIVKLY